MPKQPGRVSNKPQPVDLSLYLVDSWQLPTRDGGLCAAGCGRTVAAISRCSAIVPASTALHPYGDPPDVPRPACVLCASREKEHLAGLLATYLSPVCAHCTLVVETGRGPLCLADRPVAVYQEAFGENACSRPPGHGGSHRNERGEDWE